MSSGRIITPSFISLSGLNPAATDNSGQMFAVPVTSRVTRDVGYVSRERKFRVMLWNGTGSEVVLTGIDTNGEQSDGIETTASPPDLISAMTAQFVDITVTLDGPLEYTAQLTFVSSCSFDPILIVVGTRAPRLSGDVGYLFFPHNWDDGLDESLTWKTDVLVAHNRSEQRIQLRTIPRRAWDLKLLVSGDGRRKLETWAGLRKTRYLFTPVWRDETRITAPITAGYSAVQVDTRYLEFEVGRWLAVYDAWDHYEIRTITGIGADYVAVDVPFTIDWPAGSLIAPCRYGLGIEQRRVSRFTEDVGDYRIRFEALDESAMPAISTPETYDSVMVCPFVPSWGDGEETMDNKWVLLDNDTGLVEYDIQSIEPVLSREARFLVVGRAQIDTFFRWLFYCAGRKSPFWLAANDRGFELEMPAVIGATAIIIRPIDYDYALSGSNARGHVEMITVGGDIIRRRIIAVETLPNGLEQLTIDSGLPVEVSAATLNRCAWLEQCRLDSDSVNLKWWSGECIEATLPVVVLP